MPLRQIAVLVHCCHKDLNWALTNSQRLTVALVKSGYLRQRCPFNVVGDGEFLYWLSLNLLLAKTNLNKCFHPYILEWLFSGFLIFRTTIWKWEKLHGGCLSWLKKRTQNPIKTKTTNSLYLVIASTNLRFLMKTKTPANPWS